MNGTIKLTRYAPALIFRCDLACENDRRQHEAVITQITALFKDHTAVMFTRSDDDRRTIIFKLGDVYRAARFDRRGAVGHSDYTTAAAAAESVTFDFISGSTDVFYKAN